MKRRQLNNKEKDKLRLKRRKFFPSRAPSGIYRDTTPVDIASQFRNSGLPPPAPVYDDVGAFVDLAANEYGAQNKYDRIAQRLTRNRNPAYTSGALLAGTRYAGRDTWAPKQSENRGFYQAPPSMAPRTYVPSQGTLQLGTLAETQYGRETTAETGDTGSTETKTNVSNVSVAPATPFRSVVESPLPEPPILADLSRMIASPVPTGKARSRIQQFLKQAATTTAAAATTGASTLASAGTTGATTLAQGAMNTLPNVAGTVAKGALGAGWWGAKLGFKVSWEVMKATLNFGYSHLLPQLSVDEKTDAEEQLDKLSRPDLDPREAQAVLEQPFGMGQVKLDESAVIEDVKTPDKALKVGDVLAKVTEVAPRNKSNASFNDLNQTIDLVGLKEPPPARPPPPTGTPPKPAINDADYKSFDRTMATLDQYASMMQPKKVDVRAEIARLVTTVDQVAQAGQNVSEALHVLQTGIQFLRSGMIVKISLGSRPRTVIEMMRLLVKPGPGNESYLDVISDNVYGYQNAKKTPPPPIPRARRSGKRNSVPF